MLLLEMLQDLFLLFGFLGETKSFPEPLSREEEKLYCERLKQGDCQAREELILHNLRLVAHIAKKYVKSGREPDDVISIGTIGLIKAVTSFDPDKGTALSSYASRCVENEILMSLRAERKQAPEVSINEPIGVDADGNNVALADILGTDPSGLSDEVCDKIHTDLLCCRMKQVLTEREYTVLRLRYGLFGAYQMTQREIASLLGISRSYISRIEKKAVQRLQEEMEKLDPRG